MNKTTLEKVIEKNTCVSCDSTEVCIDMEAINSYLESNFVPKERAQGSPEYVEFKTGKVVANTQFNEPMTLLPTRLLEAHNSKEDDK